uniref:RNA helicase n=1 Tax=Meloidogyne javanica TaxID=6303 RepID=A0A915MJS8_MELJA
MPILKVEQQNNLLDLYAEEICSRISQNLSVQGLGPLKEFLHEENLLAILSSDEGILEQNDLDKGGNGSEDGSVQNSEDSEDQEEEERKKILNAKRLVIATKIWQEITTSALRSRLYKGVLEFIRQIDDELHKSICVEGYTTEFIAGFSKLLNHSTELVEFICGEKLNLDENERKNRWHQFAESLKSNVDFDVLVDPLLKRIQSDTVDTKRATKILLRSIPVLNMNGYEHILFSVTKCDFQNAVNFVQRIYPNFFREYEYIKSSASNRHNYFYVVRQNDDISAIIEMAMKNDVPPPNANIFNARLGNIPQIHVRACTIDTCQEFPLNLRPYQKELVNEAVDGKNVIICAPTGSGKTIVGAYIIREHLFKALQKQQRAKACFVVPTASLVTQQKRLFSKYIGHFAKVRGLSGLGKAMSLNNPIKMVIEYADVIVITPQLLINELERVSTEIDESSFVPFTLDAFTLIIFDETHHSKDDHPYNVLMKTYHEMKLTGSYKDRLPQIIGMTASLGIGGSVSKNLDEAVRYTLEICANMDAQWISCIRKYQDSLRSFMPIVSEEVKFVQQASDCGFLWALTTQIEKIKNFMNEIPEANQKEVSLPLNDSNSRDPLVQGFEACFIKTTSTLSDQSRARLMFCVEQLLIFYNAIIWLKLFGVKVSFNYIQKNEVDKLICKFAIESKINVELNNWINSLQEIVNKKGMDKQNSQASREEGGQNARMQKAKLDDFSKGEIKILCATTVAEEGIDISACNLIVQYNYVTNEIARVQRRGRCRAKGARALLLTCEINIKEKEEQNALRERLMHSALEELSRWSPTTFKLRVEDLVQELNKKRKESEALEMEKRIERRKQDNLFKIVCSSCSKFLGLSTKIVLVGSMYVIVDKEFWRRTKGCASELPPEKAQGRECKGSMPHIGEHRCSCNQKLGRIIQYRGIVFIRCTSDGNEIIKDERVKERKWGKVSQNLFLIDKATTLQLVEMKDAPDKPESLLRTDLLE